TMTTKNQQATTNGQPMAVPNTPPMTMTYDATGKVLSAKGLSKNDPATSMMGSAFSSGGLAGLGNFLPTHPVKVGDTWTPKVTLPSALGNSSGTMKATFVGIQTIGQYKTAHFKTTMSMPLTIPMNVQGQP